MSETIYPKGLRVFPKHEKAPEFVKASIVITPKELYAWLKENESLLSEYKGEKQLKLQLLKGDKGLYLAVDQYKAKEKNLSNDDLNF